jgi:hypothetical protein
MGWKLFRSGDAVPNFVTVWVSLAVILLNLDRFSVEPLIPVVPYLLVAIVLPCLLVLGLWAWKTWHRGRQAMPPPARRPAVAMAAVEALDETAELDL